MATATKVTQELKDYEILIHPLVSEKAVNMIESQNKLTFIVNLKATKLTVKKAVESLHKVKVDSVQIVNDQKGRKKAIVKINKAFKADDVATKLGVL
ncbi:MAG: 50S ribosomal protein L23 [archaeon]|nr:50S ribosomal protein L23 [archaeon]